MSKIPFPSLLWHYVFKALVHAGHCNGKLKFGLLAHLNKYIYLGQVGAEVDFQRLCKVLPPCTEGLSKQDCVYELSPSTLLWMLLFIACFCGVLSSFIPQNPWAVPYLKCSFFGSPPLLISLIIYAVLFKNISEPLSIPFVATLFPWWLHAYCLRCKCYRQTSSEWSHSSRHLF